jgi:hypothetical protein
VSITSTNRPLYRDTSEPRPSAMPDDGAGPTIVAVHPVAPLPSELQSWKSTSGGSPVPALKGNVILGRRFQRHSRPSRFALPPAPLSANVLMPFPPSAVRGGRHLADLAPALLGAAIDHVMTTKNWTVVGNAGGARPRWRGSDHRPIVVKLRPATGPNSIRRQNPIQRRPRAAAARLAAMKASHRAPGRVGRPVGRFAGRLHDASLHQGCQDSTSGSRPASLVHLTTPRMLAKCSELARLKVDDRHPSPTAH